MSTKIRITCSTNLIYILSLVLFVFIRTFQNIDLLDKLPFHVDEPDYVSNSFLIDELPLTGNNLNLWKSQVAYDQPHAYHYLIGIYLKFLKRNTFNTYKNSYFTERDIKSNAIVSWNQTGYGKVLGVDTINSYEDVYRLIHEVRYLSLFLTILGEIILLLVLKKFANSTSVWILMLLLLLAPSSTLSWGLMATADALLTFLLILSLSLMIWLGQIGSGKKSFMLTVLIPIVNGLALSTKLNGIVLIPIYVLFLYFWYRKQELMLDVGQLEHFCTNVLMGLALTGLVFWTLNPFIQLDPIRNGMFMFVYRFDQAQTQALGELAFPENIINKFGLFSNNVLLDFYSKSDNFASMILVVAILSGALIIILKKRMNDKNANKTVVSLLLFMSLFMAVLIYIPLNWERYYYPASLSLIVMAAIEVGWVVNWLINKQGNKNRL